MSGFVCPHCSKTVEIFKSGGGEKTAQATGIPFLGTLPFSPEVVVASDDGTPIISKNKNDGFSVALDKIISNIVKTL